jgi:hypothetical protein
VRSHKNNSQAVYAGSVILMISSFASFYDQLRETLSTPLDAVLEIFSLLRFEGLQISGGYIKSDDSRDIFELILPPLANRPTILRTLLTQLSRLSAQPAVMELVSTKIERKAS